MSKILLVNFKGSYGSRRDKYGETALFKAARNGDTSVIEQLLDR